MSPILINIDVTGLCNETCNYCPRSSGYPNAKHYMSIELFKEFVSTLHNYKGTICFTGRGENSLHPDFGTLAMILHHDNRTYRTRILTNGYRLKEKMQYFDLFDTLIINSYKSKEQMEERKKLMPRATHRYWDQSMKPEEWGETPIQVSNRSDIYNRIATDRSAINEVCILPKTKGWIHWDGSIQMCCNDWTDTNVFGNIKTDNFFDVWKHNPELQKLKQELWEGNRAANPICATCNRLPTNRDRNKIKWLKRLEMT